MTQLTSLVMQRSAARFDMCGQKLPYNLHVVAEDISHGLVARLHRYALKRFSDAGFDVAGWKCEVSTMDADLAPCDRVYAVEFTNAKGGALSIAGILMVNGHPVLHHEVSADLG